MSATALIQKVQRLQKIQAAVAKASRREQRSLTRRPGKESFDVLQRQAWALLRPGVTATYAWGRGSGKTFFDRACIHEWCLSKPGCLVGLLMPTLKQARSVFWPHLLADYYGPLKDQIVDQPNKTNLTCEYKNGSRLSTWGAENADSIRGQRFDCLVQDEADDIDPDVERAIIEPTFSESGTRAIYLKTGTPKRGRYGTLYLGYQRGQEGTPERLSLGADAEFFASLRFRSSDSPQVDQVWLERQRRGLIVSGHESTWKREYECDFDSAEGLVYSMFESGFHVREPNYGVPYSEILVGVDHGFEDPGVFIVAGVIGNGKDAIVHLLEEVYAKGKDPSWWGARAAEVAWKYRSYRQRWYADPSRPDLIANLRRHVRNAHPDLQSRFTVDEAKNSIEPGVDALVDRIAPREQEDGERLARFYVSPRCVETIAEFSKYRRKRDRKDSERILDDIVDKDNHTLDATRYLVFTRFGGPDKIRYELGPTGRSDPEPA